MHQCVKLRAMDLSKRQKPDIHGTLGLAEVESLLDMAAAEGWNPGADDATAFFNSDPSGFVGIGDGSQLLAGISLVKQSAHQGFLGLYIAAPEARGQGLGKRVWDKAIEHARMRGLSTIGLDGVPAQQGNYQQSGFVHLYRNLRFTGAAEGLLKVTERSLDCTAFDAAMMAEAISLDTSIGGVEREGFLDTWLPPGSTRTTVTCWGQGSLKGFATVRPCRDGFKAGPVLASDTATASTLLHHIADYVLLTSKHGRHTPKITVDVPEPNLIAVDLMQAAGMEQAFETARMYMGPPPVIDTDALWGVGTLELG